MRHHPPCGRARAALIAAAVALAAGCSGSDVTPQEPAPAQPERREAPRLRVILDTDANNELDDQHAIAYLLFNADTWHIEGITTNRTRNGGGIDQHTAEAERVVRLCASEQAVRVRSGASGTFEAIKDHVHEAGYDGHEAVDFIVDRARRHTPDDKLVLIPVGKLTNIALALHKNPAIAPNVRVMWLGSNWPTDATEYNEADDHAAINHLMNSPVEFDIALVRYGVTGPEAGTAAVEVSTAEIREKMAGLGPRVAPIAGRSGGEFTTFGDYSVNLFETSQSEKRALYDLAAVALVKNPAWAQAQQVPAPHIVGGQWQARPDNPRTVRFYKNFDGPAIIADFYRAMSTPVLPR